MHGNEHTTQGQGGEQQSPNALMSVLRGRLHILAILIVVFAGPLCVLGFRSADPMYKASGELMIKQRDELFSTQLDNTGYLKDYIESEAAIIRSRRVFQQALLQPELIEAQFPTGEAGIAKLERLVRVSPPVTGQLITVSAEEPNRWFVTAAVNAVMNGYIEVHEEYQRERRKNGIEQTQRREQALRDRIDTLEQESGPLFRKYGSADALERQLASINDMRLDLVSDRRQLEGEIETNRVRIDELTAMLALHDAGQPVDGPPTIELMLNDDRMTELQEERHLIATNIRSALDRGMLPANQTIVNWERELREKETLIEDRTKLLTDLWWSRQRANVDDLRTRITADQRRLDQIREQLEEIDGQRSELSARIHEIGEYTKNIEAARNELLEVVRIRGGIEQQLAEDSLGAARIHELADLPHEDEISSDPRPMRAGAGFILGVAIAIGVVAMGSGLKHKLRFIDEFTPERLGVSCLGAVPEIKRLTASSFTEIENCVEPMRARIEVLAMRPGSRGSQVLAVTSPGPSDGKSTVARALAASFARAGHRTVLVDADPDGRATTAAYAMSGEPGFVDYLVNPDLTMIQASGKSGLWIMPAGRVDERTVSSSYASVSRMIDDLRGHFEQVVIDTGGILGSTESSLIGKAADSMVLVVARGKTLDMAELALKRIKEIGAHCVGVIFNRAEPGDFIKASIAVSSVRRDAGEPGVVPVRDEHDDDARSSAIG